MKAVQVKGYGDVNQLELVERKIPTVNADEVLVQVKACALNNTEIWMREKAYGEGSESGWKAQGMSFPRIPGSDVAGTVVEVGDGVDTSMLGRMWSCSHSFPVELMVKKIKSKMSHF